MEKQTFIYVLKLISRLEDDNNWTDEDNAIVSDHFNHLVALKEEGLLVLAGRTLNEGPDRFGIVIFESHDIQTATKMMRSDPAIKNGIMYGEVYPYSVALIR